MDKTFLQQRIDAKKLQIIALDTAISTLALGTQESYRLDTGQTTTQVTQKDVSNLQEMQTRLEGEVCVLEARLNKGSVYRVIPTF